MFTHNGLLLVILCIKTSHSFVYNGDNNQPIIETDQGLLKGVTLKTDNGFAYDVFYAIPFAKPPIGQRRFEASTAADSWEGLRDASTPGPICSQLSTQQQYSGEEDCLYLNIYIPKIRNETLKLPIIFWVHGGAFLRGSANEFDPKYLVENNVIVVTTNYRLAILGFLSLNSSTISGNTALKDIILANKWVKNNIRIFGGDVDNITIFGQSAGASLVNLLVISPAATGLFHRAVIHSGSAVSEKRIQENPERVITDLKKILNVSSDDSKNFLNILKECPVESLLLIASEISLDGRQTPFRPVVESIHSDFPIITENPRTLMKNGQFNRLPIISGHLSQEGMYLLPSNTDNVSTVEDMIQDFSYFIPEILHDALSPSDEIVVKNKIKNFYFPDNNDLINRFIDIMSDYDYIKDVDDFVRVSSRFVSNVYYFHFSYNGALNWNKYLYELDEYTGAAHADELGYIFNVAAKYSEIQIEPSELDLMVRQKMTEMWTNFAKFGTPTPNQNEAEDLVWSSFVEGEPRFLHINSNMAMETNILDERLEFWRKLSRDYSKE